MNSYVKLLEIPARSSPNVKAGLTPPGDLRRRPPAPPQHQARSVSAKPQMPTRPAPLPPGRQIDRTTLLTLSVTAAPARIHADVSDLFCADDSFRTPLHRAAAGPRGTNLVRALLERCPPKRRCELATQRSLIPDGRSLGSPGAAALLYNDDSEDVVGILVELGAFGAAPNEVAREAMSLEVRCQDLVRSWDAYAGLVQRAQDALTESRTRRIMSLPASPEKILGIDESNLIEVVRQGTRAQIQEKVRRAPNLLLHPDRLSRGRNLPIAVALIARRPDIALFLLKAMNAYQLLGDHPLDKPNAEGDTPLTLAIKFGETAVVSALLQMGAALRVTVDVSAPSKKRVLPNIRRAEISPPTVFEIAVVYGHAAVLDVLLKAEETALGAPLGNPLASLADLISAHPQRNVALELARVLESANQRRLASLSK